MREFIKIKFNFSKRHSMPKVKDRPTIYTTWHDSSLHIKAVNICVGYDLTIHVGSVYLPGTTLLPTLKNKTNL